VAGTAVRTQESNVDFATFELLQLLAGGHVDQFKPGMAMCLAEGVHGARKDILHRHRRRESHAYLAGLAGGHLPDHVTRFVEIGQCRACLVQEQFSGRRQRHVMARPFQQRAAQFIFQRLDLDAERRLADMQPAGGLAEAQRLGHGHEIAKLAKVH
jgi:hypothetical protein